MEDKMEALLKCPFCKERYRGTPKRLPCQHSVCENPCLEKLLKGTNQFRYECPQCNEKHDVPKNGTDDLPTDTLLQKHLNLYHKYDTLPVKKAADGEYLYSDDYDSQTSQITKCDACAISGNVKCLHCGKTLCSTVCKDKHMDQVRHMALEFSAKIYDSIKRLTELEESTGLILKYNPTVAANVDLKRLYQTFEHQKFEINKYLTSFEEKVANQMDDEELLAHMFQCKEHHSELAKVEFNQLILDVKRELDRHSPKQWGIDKTVSGETQVPENVEIPSRPTAKSSQEPQNKTPPVPPRAGNVAASKVSVAFKKSPGDSVEIDVTNEPDDGYEEITCVGQPPSHVKQNLPHLANNPQSASAPEAHSNSRKSFQPLGLYSKLAVCSITNVMSCFRIGIGIWNIVQHGSTLSIIAACFLMLKTIYETGCIYRLVLHKFGKKEKIRKYIFVMAFLVLLGLLLILDIVLAYTTDGNVNLPLQVMRVVTIVDWVWTILVLLSIWMLASGCFRH